MAAIENICDKLLTTTHDRPSTPSPTPAPAYNMAAAESNMADESNMASKRSRRKNAKPKSLRMQEEECQVVVVPETTEPEPEILQHDENRNEIDEEKYDVRDDVEMTSSHHDDNASLPADSDSYGDGKNDEDELCSDDDDVAMTTDDGYYGDGAYLDADDFPPPDDQTAEIDSDLDEALPRESVPIDLSVKKSPVHVPGHSNESPIADGHSNGERGKSDDLKDYAESAMNELLSMYGLKESFDGRRVPTDLMTSQTMRSLFLPAKHGPGHKGDIYKAPGSDSLGKPPALIPLSKLPLPTPRPRLPHDGSDDSPPVARLPDLDLDLGTPDYSKYVERFDSFEDCKSSMCQDMQYREHFHCMDCNNRVFVKKEEMLRHYKWHRKRDESLQHGFLRFSPLDDCQESRRFEPCVHNQKQTHYHCIQPGCNKVYVSTSDVQMHANYHRKASAIIQEGFQRFRATEDCGTLQCQFYNQRTTHFHCRRSSCNFTFKNKADMEKHKTYHQKDEILAKDGFKKFMKYEHCTYKGCRYSKQSNHIHCIRPACLYVLHSTGQLYSHKRKHERREFEFGIKRLHDDSGLNDSLRPYPSLPVSSTHSATNLGLMYETNPSPNTASNQSASSAESPRDSPQPIRKEVDLNSSLNLPIAALSNQTNPRIGRAPTNDEVVHKEERVEEPISDEFIARNVPPIMEKPERDESWKKYLTRFTANDPCVARCALLYKDHYHCNIRNCNVLFRTKERVREHGRLHDQEDRITFLTYRTVSEGDQCYIDGCTANGNKHYHCLWPDCSTVITSQSAALSRLQHFRYHEQQRHLVNATKNTSWRFTQQQLSDGGLIRRKRGRPPKFPKDEIPVVPRPDVEDSEQMVIVNDFNYRLEEFINSENGVVKGFKWFRAGEPCPDGCCPYHMAREHFHCVRVRCHHISTSVDQLRMHAHDFHNYVQIMEGFEFFDRLVNCRRPNCQNSRANKHFHCVRPRCDYAFVRHSTMYQHDKKHNGGECEDESPEASIFHAQNMSLDERSKTVKAAGTFYPLSTLPKAVGPNLPLSLPLPMPNLANLKTDMMDTKPRLLPNLATGVPTSFASTFMMPPLLNLPALIPMVTSPFQLLGSPGNPLLRSPLATSLATSMVTSQQLASQGANAITLQQASEAAAALGSLAQQSKPEVKPILTPIQTKPQPPPEVLDHWYSIRDKMHYQLDQNCGRPFCKLKKRDHYHCFDCNQAFSDPERLRAHVGRHGVKFEKPPHSKDDSLDLSLNLNGEAFAAKLAGARANHSEDSRDSFNTLEIDLDKSSDSLNSSLERHGFEETRKRVSDALDDSLVVKHRRIATPRVNKDEPVPEGYVRYWAHEDCARRGCSYRQSTTHVHCLRETCMFGICSRPRILQHTQRHARIDRIMGNEFIHYRANIKCHEPNCSYSEKSSHFHCKKCTFTAQDTIKVTAHRKYHNKNDFFVSQGFDKYTVSQNCLIKDCKYSLRNTHYHCLFPGCFASVIGQSQMAPHRLKHAGLQERFGTSPGAMSPGSPSSSKHGDFKPDFKPDFTSRFSGNSMVFPTMNNDIFPGPRESPSNDHSNRSSPSNGPFSSHSNAFPSPSNGPLFPPKIKVEPVFENPNVSVGTPFGFESPKIKSEPVFDAR